MKKFGWLPLGLLLSGCAMFGQKPETKLWIHEEANRTLPERHKREVTVPISNLNLVVDPNPTLTERDITEAEIVETAGGAAILVKFNAHGTNKLDQLTTSARGRYIVIFLNDKPIAAWLVDRRLSLGQLLVEAQMSDDEARRIVEALNEQAKKYQAKSTTPW